SIVPRYSSSFSHRFGYLAMRETVLVKLTNIVARLAAQSRSNAKRGIEILSSGGLTSVNRLVAALADPDRDIETRMTACWALGQLRVRRAAKALLETFFVPDVSLRWEAAKALIMIGAKSTVGPMLGVLEDSDDLMMRVPAAYLLGYLRDRRAVR